MGLFNIFDPILDFILIPLLNLGHLWFLLIMSFIISFGIIISTKYLTDQKLMKELKESMKNYQEQAKAHKDNPSKSMEFQKKVMEANLQYMKHSLKPTLYSFIPIIILFGWMSANIAYLPIVSGDMFNVTINFVKKYNGNVTIDVPENMETISNKINDIIEGKVSWQLKSKVEGNYELIFTTNSETLSKKVLITNKIKYVPVIKSKKTIIDFIYGSREGYLDKNSKAIQISLDNKPAKPLGNISILGWKPGWLGTYIILSLIFTLALRKIMKVY